MKTWTARECEPAAPFEFLTDSELVTVPRSAAPVLIKAWSGPITDRARLEVRQVQSADYPVTMSFVLGTALADVSEEWSRLAGTFTLGDAKDAAFTRPLGITGGVPTRRWTLRAALDPGGAIERVNCVFDLFVDRGFGASVPFSTLATGVTP